MSVLPKLQLKSMPVFLSELQFVGVTRTNLTEKETNFAFGVKTRTLEELA